MPDPRFLNPITILADIGGVSIDVTKRRDKTFEHIITQNPVEDGSPTTDHITNMPVKLSISGGFSDLQISNLVGPALSQLAWKGRAKTEFDRLLKLFVSRETFDVMDGLHLIKDMQFKSLKETKEKEGFSVHFTAELWQVQKVYSNIFHSQKISALDSLSRLKTAPQLLLSVGVVSWDDSLQSVGVLA
ncbi:hypothetical protein KKI24_14335 [bacterium]|nr:hypothetical protein [bacterium]